MVRRKLTIVVLACCLLVLPAPCVGSETEEECSKVYMDTVEDEASGLPTFATAMPSFLLDVTRCVAGDEHHGVNEALASRGSLAISGFEQRGYEAVQAIDGVSGASDNGWAYLGRLDEAWLMVKFPMATVTSKMNLCSGYERVDHHITRFILLFTNMTFDNVEEARGSDPLLAGSPWYVIPGLRGIGESVKVQEDGYTVKVKGGTSELVLTYPRLEATMFYVKIEESDTADTENAVVNEIEFLLEEELFSWTTCTMEVYLDNELLVNHSRTISLLPLHRGETAGESPTDRVLRVSLPNINGVHELRVQLGVPLEHVHFLVYDKLNQALQTYVAFPYPNFVFGRDMQPFVTVGASGRQCIGDAPLDNSTGFCWHQPHQTYYVNLDIMPLAFSGEADCAAWLWRAGHRICTKTCTRASSEGGHEYCCDLKHYAVKMRQGRYVGLSCLPDGEYVLFVHFYDYLQQFDSVHEVKITIDRSDIGRWYHRALASNASYLDVIDDSHVLREQNGSFEFHLHKSEVGGTSGSTLLYALVIPDVDVLLAKEREKLAIEIDGIASSCKLDSFRKSRPESQYECFLLDVVPDEYQDKIEINLLQFAATYRRVLAWCLHFRAFMAREFLESSFAGRTLSAALMTLPLTMDKSCLEVSPQRISVNLGEFSWSSASHSQLGARHAPDVKIHEEILKMVGWSDEQEAMTNVLIFGHLFRPNRLFKSLILSKRLELGISGVTVGIQLYQVARVSEEAFNVFCRQVTDLVRHYQAQTVILLSEDTTIPRIRSIASFVQAMETKSVLLQFNGIVETGDEASNDLQIISLFLFLESSQYILACCNEMSRLLLELVISNAKHRKMNVSLYDFNNL